MQRSTIKLLFITLCFLLNSCVDGQNEANTKKPEVTKNVKTAAINNIGGLLNKQILLTNEAHFTRSRTLAGGSGFLINYNGQSFAVTARHLLGDAGGIEPEVKLNELNKNLTKWEMMPRVVENAANQTVRLSATGLDFSQSMSDIVLLKVDSVGFEIEMLKPNFALPAEGEKLFLIGCPYSETKCKQNSYPVEYLDFDEEEKAIVCKIADKVNLRGFSGAPVVNAVGEVLGVLVSSGAINGENFIYATHIKEIQKIKY